VVNVSGVLLVVSLQIVRVVPILIVTMLGKRQTRLSNTARRPEAQLAFLPQTAVDG
jgi:hypothetical protein